MGTIRNGARTFLWTIRKACRLSHMTGFRLGLGRILGDAEATTFYALWTPFCAFVETMIALDDHFNQEDALAPSFVGGEDIPPTLL